MDYLVLLCLYNSPFIHSGELGRLAKCSKVIAGALAHISRGKKRPCRLCSTTRCDWPSTVLTIRREFTYLFSAEMYIVCPCGWWSSYFEYVNLKQPLDTTRRSPAPLGFLLGKCCIEYYGDRARDYSVTNIASLKGAGYIGRVDEQKAPEPEETAELSIYLTTYCLVIRHKDAAGFTMECRPRRRICEKCAADVYNK